MDACKSLSLGAMLCGKPITVEAVKDAVASD